MLVDSVFIKVPRNLAMLVLSVKDLPKLKRQLVILYFGRVLGSI